MTVVSTSTDVEALSFTVVAEFTAPPSRIWEVWSDPRQLERWWGPPTWPATVEEHDFTVGGSVTYFMTGPEGQKSRGWWRILAIEEPRVLEFEDGFADESGTPNPGMPTVRGRVELEETAVGTRMSVTSRFDTAAEMDKLVSIPLVRLLLRGPPQKATGAVCLIAKPAKQAP